MGKHANIGTHFSLHLQIIWLQIQEWEYSSYLVNGAYLIKVWLPYWLMIFYAQHFIEMSFNCSE